MIILKWILKKLVLFLDLIIHYNTGKSGIFGNVKEVILCKNNKYLQIFPIVVFCERIQIHDFYLSVSSKCSKLLKINLCLQRENKLLLTQN